jgi:hypothetical protein
MAGQSKVSGNRSRRRPGSRFIRGRPLHSAGHAQARQARPAARRGSAMKRHGARRRGSATVQGDTRYQQGSRDCPRILSAMRGPDRRPSMIFRGLAGPSPRTADHCNRGNRQFGEPPDLPPRPGRSDHTSRPIRADDRGRCRLYVRAQLDTAGLSWTQWDLVRPKATARETGNNPAHGLFPQVLGSNQRRLSRRFYRPLLFTPVIYRSPATSQLRVGAGSVSSLSHGSDVSGRPPGPAR